jgi:hypothetical protein
MHPLFKKADELSRQAIGAAIKVRRLKGLALIESIWESIYKSPGKPCFASRAKISVMHPGARIGFFQN